MRVLNPACVLLRRICLLRVIALVERGVFQRCVLGNSQFRSSHRRKRSNVTKRRKDVTNRTSNRNHQRGQTESPLRRICQLRVMTLVESGMFQRGVLGNR